MYIVINNELIILTLIRIPGELFTSAADLATESMKGKLASKYYMLAEEAWAECEEEE